MPFVANFPSFSILLCMVSGVVSSILPARKAKWLSAMVSGAAFVLSLSVLIHMIGQSQPFTYMMGHFPAPWGNELRVGKLEALMATVLSLVMLLTQLATLWELDTTVTDKKQNLYCIMMNLLLAALLVMLYTNDLFTAYVFIEINTIAACALIIARQNGHALAAGMRYMIMNLLGSGLIMLGISILYAITGHLLMPQLQEAVVALYQSGKHRVALTVVVGLFTVAIAIKSGLFPFHEWVPYAYPYAPQLSSALLSGLLSKGYIFLLIKIFYRVFTTEVVAGEHVGTILFLFGFVGLIGGSVSAIFQKDIRRMVAYSSVSQIAYIYMGIALGTTLGMMSALFHMLVHAAAKTLLFISIPRLSQVSDGSRRFDKLRGAGYRDRVAGVAFTVGALSMVGIPLTGGFISKFYYTTAAMELEPLMRTAVILSLAISTLLNTIYYMHTVVSLYRKEGTGNQSAIAFQPRDLAMSGLAVITIVLGVAPMPIIQLISQGLALFS